MKGPDHDHEEVAGEPTSGVSWRRRHLMRRRLADVLDHADALERDVERLLEEHERQPGRAALLHEVLRLRAELTEVDRVMCTYARERGIDPTLPTPELRMRLPDAIDSRGRGSGYTGPERRRTGRRVSDSSPESPAAPSPEPPAPAGHRRCCYGEWLLRGSNGAGPESINDDSPPARGTVAPSGRSPAGQ